MPDPDPPDRLPFGHAKRPARPAVPPPPPPAFEVVEDDDFEVVEDDPPAVRRPVRAAASPAPARDKPRPPKKRKPKPKGPAYHDPESRAQAARDQALAHYEWVAPTVILAFGLVLCFVGGIRAGGAIGVGKTLLVLAVGLAVTVPLAVAALMAIGIAAGIDYGRLTSGVLKIAAITCVANGIMFLGDSLGLPPFMYLPFSGLVTLVLFMTQFELEYGEANVSVGAINLMSFGVKTVLFLFLLGSTQKSAGPKDEYPDDPADDDPPADVRPVGEPGKKNRPPRPVVPDGGDPGDDE